jgi:uncharacterized protein (TIGR01777 family)
MKDRIIITGYSGSLAKITRELLKDNYEIIGLTSNKKRVNNKNIYYWNTSTDEIDERALENCKHIIHLSGYPILKRWTKKNKILMQKSRIGAANLLFNKCKKLNISPKTFISASAIGIYGLDARGIKSEKDKIGTDWIARMASDWEESAQEFKKIGSRVVQMRISLLMNQETAFLKYNLLSMKLGIGVVIGSKNKKISWIHVDDATNFIKEAITNENYKGAYNLATTKPISQEMFIKKIKERLFPYALIIRIPSFIIRLFLGKRSQIINTDVSINVDKLKKEGFIWKFYNFNQVLEKVRT